MLKGKSLLGYTNVFSPNDYEKNDKIILKYFQYLKRWKNYICKYYKILFVNLYYICGKYKIFEKPKI